jgi:hypothetical protein
MAAPTTPADVKKSLANPEPSSGRLLPPIILEPVRRETSVALDLPQQLRQLRDVDGDPARLVVRQHLRLPSFGLVSRE